MWSSVGQAVQMVEGDYGIELPITISGVTFSEHDSVKLKIARGETVLIEKVFDNISNNAIALTLTESESELLPVGVYVYSLDWYQDDVFMCNIVQRNGFRVVDKL